MKIIQSILAVLSIIFIIFIIDLFSISDKNKPIIYFSDIYSDDGYYLYKGILYDTYDCVGNEVERGTHIVFRWNEFECKKINQFEVSNLKVTNIVDNTVADKNYVCDEKKEVLFEDSVTRYYFNCTKSAYIMVTYDDGTSDNLKAAISKGNVTMSDLDKYKINYEKESIVESE